MSPVPARPPAPGEPERGPRERAQPGEPEPAGPQPGERYGPVEIARYVKDDGRTLLLYTRSPRESP
jgi:hypothetical protein